MNQEQEQILLAQLAAFLKTYKLVFSSKLNLFHIILTHQDPKPLSSKIFGSHIQYIHSYPENIQLNSEKVKIIERFCLRITQFLQYRLCLLKSLKQQWLLTEIVVFENGLKKLFNQLKTFETLSIVMKKIVDYRNTFAKRILAKISQKNILNNEQFKEINDLFQQILLKNMDEKNDISTQRQMNSTSIIIKSIAISQKNTQFMQPTNLQNSQPLFKKKQCFKISQRSNHNNCSTRLKGNQNWEQLTLRNKTENAAKERSIQKTIESQQKYCQKFSKKSKAQLYLQDLKKILQLQSMPKIHSQYIIRKQLVELNKKNSNIINKFIRKCNEKKTKKQTKKSLQIKKKENSNNKQKISSEKAIIQYKVYKAVNQRKVLKLNKPITIMNPNVNPNVNLNKFQALTARQEGFPIIQKRIIQALGF